MRSFDLLTIVCIGFSDDKFDLDCYDMLNYKLLATVGIKFNE